MMNINTAETFFGLMEAHVALYAEMKKAETDKMADIAENRFEKLDAYVKKEEALILKARGLEISRDNFLKDHGLEDKKMTDIIAALPKEKKADGEQYYKTLSSLVFDIKRINERCASMSELRLHRIENAINRLQNTPKSENSYDDEAKQKSPSGSVISKKI